MLFPQWHSAPIFIDQSMSANLNNWLTVNCSMTARMEARCEKVEVIALQHDWQLPFVEEATELGIPTNVDVIVREIVMRCDDEPWLFARTIIPASVMVGALAVLRELGHRSIGKLLYSIPGVTRSAFTFRRLDHNDALYRKAIVCSHIASDSLWARHSVFNVPQGQIAVFDVFLPEMVQHLA